MTKEEQVNHLNELLNKHYYKFIKEIENIEEENLDIDGIINIFINNFDETISHPLDNILRENNIEYSYELHKYIDYNEE